LGKGILPRLRPCSIAIVRKDWCSMLKANSHINVVFSRLWQSINFFPILINLWRSVGLRDGQIFKH
jgi:hypothetical protein